MNTSSPSPQTASKNWFLRHKIITGIVGVFVALFLLGSLGGESQKASPTDSGDVNGPAPARQNEAEEVGQEAPSAEMAKSYQSVITFKGNGAKKSEPFIIAGDRFKIAYDCQGDLCQAMVYKTGSNIPASIIMNKTGSTKDETVIYGSGEYYIDANTIGSYTMTVSDFK